MKEKGFIILFNTKFDYVCVCIIYSQYDLQQLQYRVTYRQYKKIMKQNKQEFQKLAKMYTVHNYNVVIFSYLSTKE